MGIFAMNKYHDIFLYEKNIKEQALFINNLQYILSSFYFNKLIKIYFFNKIGGERIFSSMIYVGLLLRVNYTFEM